MDYDSPEFFYLKVVLAVGSPFGYGFVPKDPKSMAGQGSAVLTLWNSLES